MKNRIITILVFVLCLMLLGCSNDFSHVKDANGPMDYSIVTFTDSDIINSNINISFMSIDTHNDINRTYGTKAGKFSGVREIYVSKEETTVKVNLKVEKGNYRCTVIRNNAIEEEITMGENEVHLLEGDKIKICGESLKFDLRIQEK